MENKNNIFLGFLDQERKIIRTINNINIKSVIYRNWINNKHKSENPHKKKSIDNIKN